MAIAVVFAVAACREENKERISEDKGATRMNLDPGTRSKALGRVRATESRQV